jgi:hypothetical protein
MGLAAGIHVPKDFKKTFAQMVALAVEGYHQ